MRDKIKTSKPMPSSASFYNSEFLKGCHPSKAYLQDFNYLMDLMNQMDLEFSRNRILDYLPNSTNCMTWPDVKASHETDSPKVIIRIENIYGMLILLAVGLCGSLIVFILELFMSALKEWQGRRRQA